MLNPVIDDKHTIFNLFSEAVNSEDESSRNLIFIARELVGDADIQKIIDVVGEIFPGAYIIIFSQQDEPVSFVL